MRSKIFYLTILLLTQVVSLRAEEGSKQNIVVFLADDMGWGAKPRGRTIGGKATARGRKQAGRSATRWANAEHFADSHHVEPIAGKIEAGATESRQLSFEVNLNCILFQTRDVDD